ncbi:gamma-glutamyl-gamma-aminobutyrate hydrolase family protein [Hydrogenibacillus schlegelii]|uniref:Para-aminobenzoate synthase, amidotransferase component n=1 Tax=Hydrogenibacillus schlegelii TaxID=1484 RepID=A0A179ILT2_HYDSH|nr:gamma-glutamyl-gamma-aminobutyrate hydrolase family protein [Hydrogenibacillus schlegelii]OAR03203.1 hypothetical protein SA87_04725 [Hydrogenibacillus schlegelii]PTQ53695.1 MAG: Para-aminobenzoate synthase, amidotransferase component [Hydrogenibacillus schlegelii]
MRPVIGIIPSRDEGGRYTVHRDYLEAVEAAGGLPVVIGYAEADQDVRRRLLLIDGLLLTGGGDLDPASFGEAPHPSLGTVEPERDAFELALARLAAAMGLPLFGICRGAQLLNVAFGGDLHQDLPAQWRGPLVMHMQRGPRAWPAHAVGVAPDSRLGAIVGAERLRVNSFHHQAIRRVAPGWRAVAWSDDGVIEAIERPDGPLALGVQWHAEALAAAGAWEQRRLFAAFVEAARASADRTSPDEAVPSGERPGIGRTDQADRRGDQAEKR